MKPRTAGFVFLLILVVSFLFRYHGTGEHSLWIDELCTASDARESISFIVHRFIGNGHPFYTMLAKGSIALFGESDATVRLPAVIFGTMAVLMTAILVLELAGGRACLAAGLLGITFPAQIVYSGNARGYSMTYFFTALSLWLLLRALRSPTVGRWLLHGTSLSLLVYSHLLCGGVMTAAQLVFLVLYLLINQTRFGFAEAPLNTLAPRVLAGLLLGGLLTGIAYSPWFLNMDHVRDMQTYSTYRMDVLESFRHFLHVMWNWTLSSAWWWQMVWVGFAILGFVRLFSSGLSELSLLVGCWIGVPILLNSVITDTACIEDRYVVYWMPLLVLLTVLGGEFLLEACRRMSVDPARRIAALVLVHPVAAMALLMTANIGPARNAAHFHLDDWRGVSRLIRSFHPERSRVFMTPTGLTPYALTYYGVPTDRIFASHRLDHLNTEVENAIRKGEIAWLVSRHSFYPQMYLSEENSKDFFQVVVVAFARISVWCRLPGGMDEDETRRMRRELVMTVAEAVDDDPLSAFLAAAELQQTGPPILVEGLYERTRSALYPFAYADPRYADPRFGSMQPTLLEWLGRVEWGLGEFHGIRLGETDRMIRHYSRWGALRPTSPKARRELGWSYYKERAEDLTLFYWLRTAEAYRNQGDSDESDYHLEKARNLAEHRRKSLHSSLYRAIGKARGTLRAVIPGGE